MKRTNEIMTTRKRKTATGASNSRTAKKRTVKKAYAKKKTQKKKVMLPVAPIVAAGSPQKYRARVRMYRHGLGDCFLVTFPRKQKAPFQILIDCGALARDKQFMTGIVEHIRDTVRGIP